MVDPATVIAASLFGTAGIALFNAALLRGWQAWLDFKMLELEIDRRGTSQPSAAPGMFDVADLKERVRKLEAIANGTDL